MGCSLVLVVAVRKKFMGGRDLFLELVICDANAQIRMRERGLGESGNRLQSLMHKSAYSCLLSMVTPWGPKSFAAVPTFLSLGSGAML